MTGRGMLAIGILAAWGAGIAAYAQREMSRTPKEKLAEIAARVGPGATYFAVEHEGRHVGFASNTIDTIPGGLQVTDYFVADLAVEGTQQRTSAQSVVRLSRGLVLRDFAISYGSDSQPMRATGRVEGDSLLELVVGRTDAKSDTSRMRLTGPLFLPTLVPLAMALGEPPRIGHRSTFQTFDPTTMTAHPLTVAITAESLFVVVDSATFAPVERRWRGVHSDTVRGFRIVAKEGGRFDSWVDEQGRMISVLAPTGLTFKRTAYEVAFENWRTASPFHARRLATDSDATRTTMIAAGVTVGANVLDTLRLRVRGADLTRLPINGGSQSIAGDTVTIVRDGAASLLPSFPLPPSDVVRRRFGRELRSEPLLEVEHQDIVALARRLKGRDAMAEVVARRISAWVHDSLSKEVTVTLPSAVATLRSRRGDCNEHAQLFVALARAAGIPSRTVSGVIAVDGKFYYHAWGEVLLQHWVGVDPMLGEFPTDASHVRLLVGGLTMQSELSRVIDRLQLDVVSRSPLPSRHD